MSEQHREAAPLDFSQDDFDGAHRRQPQTPESHLPLQVAQQQQQQQQRPDSHAIALEQARRVLDATNNLDGFNLLGVVANPRGPHPYSHHHPYSASTSSSSNSQYHRRPTIMTTMSHTNNNSNANNSNTNNTPSTGEYGSGLEDTMLALESTLAGVTEQIDAINFVFER